MFCPARMCCVHWDLLNSPANELSFWDLEEYSIRLDKGEDIFIRDFTEDFWTTNM